MFNMTEKQLEAFVEVLLPHIEKRLLGSTAMKTVVKRKNASVINTRLSDGASNIGQKVEVMLPYDTTSFFVTNETGYNLKTDDLVCIEYCIDLKNAVAVYKVN